MNYWEPGKSSLHFEPEAERIELGTTGVNWPLEVTHTVMEETNKIGHNRKVQSGNLER